MGTSTSSQNGTRPDDAPAAEKPLFEPVWVRVSCNIKHLETVSVEVNIMASIEEVNELPRQIASKQQQNTIRDLQGWPTELFGPDPYGAKAPIAFVVWVAQAAVSQAVRQLAHDPNSTTLPTISSNSIGTETSAAFQTDYATSL